MNDDTQRIIGRLEEFKKMATDEFRDIKHQLKELQHFKVKVSVYLTLIIVVIEAGFHWLTGGKG